MRLSEGFCTWQASECERGGNPAEKSGGPVAYARGSDWVLDLHRQPASAKTAHAKTATQRQIDATDRQLDRLVYELYGLTDDEIRIVEDATQ